MVRAPRVYGWSLTLLLAACGTTTGPEFASRLLGEWTWLDSTGGIAGVTQTPATEGYTMTLAFYESGEVELFRDGASQLRTSFDYFVGPEGSTHNIGYGQPLFGFDSAGVELIPGDTLLLIDPCCDGFVRRWVR